MIQKDQHNYSYYLFIPLALSKGETAVVNSAMQACAGTNVPERIISV